MPKKPAYEELERRVRELEKDAVERKQAEERHRENEQRMKLALDGTGDGIWDWNVDNGEITLDDNWARILGYEPGEMEFDFTWWEKSIHPESAPVFEEALNTYLEGKKKYYEIEYRIQTKSGKWKWIWARGKCVKYDEQGRPLRMIGTHTDITKRKQVEAQVTRKGSVLTAINRVFKEALTCETEEELGKTCLAVAEELTGSKFGFIGELNQAGSYDTIAISNPGWDACKMPDSDATKLLMNMPLRGIWARPLKDGKSLVLSDPSSHPDSVGTPGGHPPITSFLGVPLKHAGRTFGMFALGNKEGGYDVADQGAAEDLSVAIVEALRNKRAEEALQKAHEELERRVRELEKEADMRKRAEEALQDSEQRFRTSVENMLDCFGIYSAIRDKSGRIIDFQIDYVNKTACESNLMTKEEQIGKRLCELLPAHRESGLFDQYCRLVETGKPLAKESLIYDDVYKKKCLIRAFDIRATRLGDGFAAAWRDVTEVKRAEEALQKAHEELEQRVEERTAELSKANKQLKREIEERKQAEEALRDAQEEMMRKEKLATIGELSGGIAHELRNPLGVIDSSAYYLKKRLKEADEKVQEHLDRIKSQVGSATAIIDSLLNLTRIKEPRLKTLDLRAITSEGIATSKVPDAINVIQGFPEEEVLVNADPKQLGLALRNIVTNGIEAMDGKGRLTVTISRLSDDQAELSFADTGPGIDPENLERIFQPLFSTKAKGIGFGLSIAKMIIDKHAGTIEAGSETGKGATITVRLPLYVNRGKKE